jgi:chemotaxis protein CheC
LQLTEFQKDAVREVMSIAAGHASTAMARALKREVDINVPSIQMCPLEEVTNNLGDLENLTMMVYTEVSGGLKGRLLTIFSKKDSLRLAGMITGRKVQKLKDVSGETITNLADILSVSYLGAISDFFGMKIVQSPSEMAYDMLGALLEQVIVDLSQLSEWVLLSKNDIFVSSEKFNCHQILFLEPSSLESLLKALEVKI